MTTATTEPDAERPLVTVLVVCYNHARWVREALDSVAAQTYEHRQVLILDDASTDNSVEVIRTWLAETGSSGLLIAHERNRGVCATLNEGVGKAEGEFVSILAADDVWLPEKLERQVQKFQELGEEFGVVYSDAWRMDEAGVKLDITFIDAKHKDRPEFRESGNLFPTLVDGNFIPAPGTMVRRSSYLDVGPFDEALCYEDWDMWLRLARKFQFAYSDYVSATYRVVMNSLLRRSIKTQAFAWMTSNIAIAEKASRMNGVSDQERVVLAGHAMAAAEALYRQRSKGRAPWIRRALQIRPSSRGRLMSVMSNAAVPYHAFRVLDHLHSRLAGR